LCWPTSDDLIWRAARVRTSILMPSIMTRIARVVTSAPGAN
jgi:hypothetical protein